jgi:pimeloyl-ACP methyl ester carboxylesterase
MHTEGARWLYLHGFASGPRSSKGLALAEHYRKRGVELGLLDLRVPSLEQLRLTAMMQVVREAIGSERDRAVLFGSSLGGLTAARVAEADARVCALVLLAPAFRLVERWGRKMGEEAWRKWQESNWLTTEDYAENRTTQVHFDFIRDAEAIDAVGDGWPDVRVPVLILHGRADDTVDIDLSRDWARGKRHVRLVEVDDGHQLTASLPRIIAEADDFLCPFLSGG